MKKIKKLEELIEINALLSSQMDHQEILQSISFSALVLLQCDSAEVWSRQTGAGNDEEFHLELLQAAGSSDTGAAAQPLRLPADDSPPPTPRLKKALKAALPGGAYKPRQCQGAFFYFDDTIAGFFSVSRESSDPLTEEDLYFLKQLARQAGISLLNSERFQTLRKDRDQALQENRLLKGGRDFVGHSDAAEKLMSLIRQVAPSTAPVLILGERGVGKELVCDALHKNSRRGGKQLVKVNCAGIVESLLESELFGHEKGAFTGADRQKKGLLEEAQGGSLFLDEIGDMPETMQVKLLRFLQEGTFRRVGGNKDIKVDVRVIAATNRNVEGDREGEFFRRDLFDRLSTVILRIPPLRRRPEDIVHLLKHFLEKFRLLENKTGINGFTPELITRLENYAWPGNVRELENLVHRLVILHRQGKWLQTSDDVPLINSDISPGNLPPSPPTAPPPGSGAPTPENDFPDLRGARAAFEENYIRRALTRTGGNISRAARLAGLDRGNLKIKMRKYGIAVNRER